MLQIKALKVKATDKEILKGVDLTVKPGEVHVVMGPNGSGKSTLAQVIAGSPFYKITSGSVSFSGKRLNKLSADKRAKVGIFLGFQNPVEIPGVAVFNVLRKAALSTGPVSGFLPVSARSKLKSKVNGKTNGDLRAAGSPPSAATRFREQLLEYASSLRLSDDHLKRSFNEGFSGGEKKRNEILQMLALKPKLVILDEIDSGLDVDGLRLVVGAVKKFTLDNPRSSIVLITHYARILKYIKADFVHVMTDGRIVKSGKQKLARDIEESGYEFLKKSTVHGLQSTAVVGSQ